MPPESSITLTGDAARDFVRALTGGVTAEAMLRALVEALPMAERRAAFAELMRESAAISLAEATAMTPWTESGFLRVANRENCPFIKGPHKSPRAYRIADVAAMLDRLRVWPHGRPLELHAMRAA